MLDKIQYSLPIFNRQSIIDSEELTALELAGRTTEKVNEAIDAINTGIASIAGKEDSTNITNNRKLSTTGNFTGTLAGRNLLLLLAEIDNNKNGITYLANQFADGQTGLMVDGGYFYQSAIDKNYDGGVF